jgi:hypothetical protein
MDNSPIPNDDQGSSIDGDGNPNPDDHGILFSINKDGEIARDLWQSACIRVLWGPGKVEWQHSTPGAGGQFFSVAPETTPTLVWAAAPQQDIDAIYNRFWGCGIALKIPSSCTATVTTSGGITACCNAAAAAIGHVPVWVNTYADTYFVDCPL